MKPTISREISVLRAISSAVVRERNVRRLFGDVIDILDREMGMLRGTIALLRGNELRIEASARTLDQRLAATERSILEDALRRHNGNRSAAGRELGVSPRMMNYRLNRAGIQS